MSLTVSNNASMSSILRETMERAAAQLGVVTVDAALYYKGLRISYADMKR
jgi:hypothetical protein